MYGGYLTPGMAPALPGALYPPHVPPQQPGAAAGSAPLPSTASGAVLAASSTVGLAPPQPPLPPAGPSDASAEATDGPMPVLDEDNDPDLKEFDEQFKGWEQQFNQWKKENADHPDKDALVK